mmetsp:Transcript_22489/g.42256  ORF Transcript_22489/g.42256 Transcript_22489/m.42256 type:complete len:211 (-) Transcript_22489:641-1273(-)
MSVLGFASKRMRAGPYTRISTKRTGRHRLGFAVKEPKKQILDGNGCSNEKGFRAREFMSPMSCLRRINPNEVLTDHKTHQTPTTLISRPDVWACYYPNRESDLTKGSGKSSTKEIDLSSARRLFAHQCSETVRIFPDAPMSIVLQIYLDGKHLIIVHDVNDKNPDVDPFYKEIGFITEKELMRWVTKRSWISKMPESYPRSCLRRRKTMM